MRVLILGGGISGRLAHSVFGPATVIERNNDSKAMKLTRMFGTNYLWEPLDGFECRQFDVYTTVDGKPGTEEAIARYKRKIGKPEDIGNWGLQFDYHTKGYDFVETPQCPMLYGVGVYNVDMGRRLVEAVGASPSGAGENGLIEFKFPYDVLINTLPLNTFAKLAHLGAVFPVETAFKAHAIYIKVDAVRTLDGMMHVNYFSDPLIPEYRTCLRDNFRHTEYLNQPAGPSICLQPGKIKPSPLVPKILEHLESNNVYCVGRFASWAPNELVHETYKRLKELKCRIS